MTVSTTINKVSYIGNGVATEFAIPFPFLETSHLKAYQLLNDIQTERTDWIVQNDNMIFTAAPVSGAQIVIMREVPYTQETDYRENEILAAETLERNFDKLTMQVQQLKEQIGRSVMVDIFDNTDTGNLISSINRAVSACAEYEASANEKAQTAIQMAQNAENSAQTASSYVTEKADKNLSNTNPSILFIKTVMSWIMPDWNNHQTITALSFTAPSKGWIVGQNMGTAEYRINDVYVGGCIATPSWSSRGNIQILVDEGDVVTFEEADFSQAYLISFVPCKGETTTV